MRDDVWWFLEKNSSFSGWVFCVGKNKKEIGKSSGIRFLMVGLINSQTQLAWSGVSDETIKKFFVCSCFMVMMVRLDF